MAQAPKNSGKPNSTRKHEEDILDDAVKGTFPASDPVGLSAIRPEEDERLAEAAARKKTRTPRR